jgi:cystathionine beta-lyase/cystathionine gamma-synthase
MRSGQRPKTAAVHGGEAVAKAHSTPLSPPIDVASVSYFHSADELDRSLDGEDFVYTRIRGQTAEQLEAAVAALEGAEECAAFASGMAALKAVWEAQPLAPGDRVVVPQDGYGATRALYKKLAAGRGVGLFVEPLSTPSAAERIVGLRPKLVLAETLGNPLLSVSDLPALAAACKEVGATFVVDGTFSSPVLQRTLLQGAHYAVQSTTKWMNGHSDAMGGTVSGARARIAPLKAARVLDGALLGPFEAWLTLRGFRTLPVRMQAHSEHALFVAKKLEQDGRLVRVIYPGLPSHPQHELARSLLSLGFGGMVSFEIRGAGRKEAFRFLESLRLCKPAPSLGDVATLVMHAASASARRMTLEEREVAGIGENLIRVSVGLEDPEDIVQDLLLAVEAAMGSGR